MAGLRYAMSGNFPAAQRGESVRRTGQVSGPGDWRYPETGNCGIWSVLSDSLVFGICIIKKEENERKEERKDKK